MALKDPIQIILLASSNFILLYLKYVEDEGPYTIIHVPYGESSRRCTKAGLRACNQ